MPQARVEPPPTTTKDEWLAQAKPAQEALLKGDHVSPRLIEELFLQSVPVIEAEPPVGRKQPREGA